MQETKTYKYSRIVSVGKFVKECKIYKSQSVTGVVDEPGSILNA